MRNKPKFDRDDVILGVLIIVLTFLVLAAILSAAVADAVRNMRVTSPAADEPSDGGVQRVTAAVRYMAPAEEDAEFFTIEEYREGDGPAPEWYRPDEPMAAEWEADNSRTDIGCPDWNLNTALVGWDGHTAEPWELELYARITYLEFWGTSAECCEAGADSILQLWDSGYYGDTLGDTLTARAEDGSLVYSPFAYVWDWEYDPDGLADMRALCEERFSAGPEWEAPFFRLWYYHSWAVPAREIDGVYFSTSPWLD
jgi:hypothetical protein